VPESRKHPRKEVHPPVSFKVDEASPRLDAVCHDISLGGMFIETPHPAKFGSKVTVYLQLPGLPETAIQATVRWTKPTGMGVQFGMMGARETHAMMKLLG